MISTNIIVSQTPSIEVTALITSVSGIGTAADLGEIDTTNVGNGYIFAYNGQTQTYGFENPDDMLSRSVEDNSLPTSFINKLDDELDNRIDADGGIF